MKEKLQMCKESIEEMLIILNKNWFLKKKLRINVQCYDTINNSYKEVYVWLMFLL